MNTNKEIIEKRLNRIVSSCQKIIEEEIKKMNFYMDNGMVYNPVSQSHALVIEGIVDQIKQNITK